MGLLGSLLSNPVMAHVIDMTRAERTAAVEQIACDLSASLGVSFDDAVIAVRAAVSIGEGPLLETTQGRSVILHDAAESITRGAH